MGGARVHYSACAGSKNRYRVCVRPVAEQSIYNERLRKLELWDACPILVEIWQCFPILVADFVAKKPINRRKRLHCASPHVIRDWLHDRLHQRDAQRHPA